MSEHAKRNGIWPLIALSCLPLLIIVKPPATPTPQLIALYIGALSGYVGVMFLLWMFMLGAKSAMGLVFKDLAPVFTIHKSLGKWGSIAFLLHPLLVAYSYFELKLQALTYVILPDISAATERHITLGRIAFYLILIIWVSSKLIRKQIGFRAWKYLHYFAYIALPFVLLHVPELGSQYAAHTFVKLYFWAIVGTFALFCVIRLSGWLNFDRKSYRIISQKAVTDEDYMLVLRPQGSTRLQPRLGQYVYLKQGIISEDHPFSITYYDKSTGELTLTYRMFGQYTQYLAKLKPGTVASVMGPFGSFTSQLQSTSQQPVVYLAGGVGITPFVQRVTDENDVRVQYVFAANRTHASAVLTDTLKPYLGERLVSIISREDAAPGEEHGHITAEVLTKHIKTPRAYQYYLCGPQPFVAECKRILQELGVPKTQVAEEEFSW